MICILTPGTGRASSGDRVASGRPWKDTRGLAGDRFRQGPGFLWVTACHPTLILPLGSDIRVSHNPSNDIDAIRRWVSIQFLDGQSGLRLLVDRVRRISRPMRAANRGTAQAHQSANAVHSPNDSASVLRRHDVMPGRACSATSINTLD